MRHGASVQATSTGEEGLAPTLVGAACAAAGVREEDGATAVRPSVRVAVGVRDEDGEAAGAAAGFRGEDGEAMPECLAYPPQQSPIKRSTAREPDTSISTVVVSISTSPASIYASSTRFCPRFCWCTRFVPPPWNGEFDLALRRGTGWNRFRRKMPSQD